MNINLVRMTLALSLGIVAAGCDHQAAKEAVEAHDAAVNDAAATSTAEVSELQNINQALSSLPPEDLKLAEEQRYCAVHVYHRLGSTGAPIKVETTGKPIFVCSQECVDDVKQGGAAIKRMASGLRKSTKRLLELSAEDQTAAELQKYCPVMSNRLLGTMGKPIKLVFEGQPVFICCPDCLADAEADPTEMLARVEQLKNHQAPLQQTQDHEHHHHDNHGEHKQGVHGHDDGEHDGDSHHQ